MGHGTQNHLGVNIASGMTATLLGLSAAKPFLPSVRKFNVSIQCLDGIALDSDLLS